ncbi:PHP domain-containing protein [Bacillus sp. FJAT-44742]|uniref:PHP domain-containing protein n=1 Tax=Bacillus sp. FJAT-44742 TaxID=2014005 RepID=UPI000C235330|nr:PHP domain-containing protein [Bacillus sp. FJAT-44742]
MQADLHMHSTASDGGYSPAKLMEKCKEAGIHIVALTDHDTTNGVKEAQAAGEQLGLTVIPGIELSTKWKGKSVHMLGYGVNIEDAAFQEVLEGQRQMRNKRMEVMLERLQGAGVTLQEEDVLRYVDGGSVGRPHVAKALIDRGYVKEVSEAFDKYLGEGKPAYVSKAKEFTPEEAISLIHQAGGLAVVAHPGYYGLDEDIEKWVHQSGLDGVEIEHRDHDPEERKHYEKLTSKLEKETKKTLLRTGGSDFHHEEYGRKKEPLGVTTISGERAEILLHAIEKRHSSQTSG